MRPSKTGRQSKRWRKNSPMIHRSFAEKRGRMDREYKEEKSKYVR